MISDLGTALVFWPAAAIMLITALYVFRTSSMARAGLLLLVALGVEGLIFIALASEFLGVLQLLMMAGEMVIMVFFMVMFMADPGGLMGMDMTHDKRRSSALALLVTAGLAILSIATDWPGDVVTGTAPDVRAIGFEIMGRSMFSFLFAGITILFAMVGAIMLAKLGGRFDLPPPGDVERGADAGAGEHRGHAGPDHAARQHHPGHGMAS
ncbi:MAG: NADH-quinone oxidoreductase subunit J [Solirubrobacterales bacterium]